MAIHLTVILKAKEELTNEVKNQLFQLVELSRKEKGCLQYDLHQSTTESNVFVLHEVWENQEILNLHNSQDYLKNFFALAPSLLAVAPNVIFTNKLV
jgi:quinol monooxygenase YgiN